MLEVLDGADAGDLRMIEVVVVTPVLVSDEVVPEEELLDEVDVLGGMIGGAGNV